MRKDKITYVYFQKFKHERFFIEKVRDRPDKQGTTSDEYLKVLRKKEEPTSVGKSC